MRMNREGSGPTGHLRGERPSKRVSAWSEATGGDEQGTAVEVFNETVVRGKRVKVEVGQAAAYVHVGDGILLTSEKGQSEQLMHLAADALEGLGFRVSDGRGDQEVEKIVGYVAERRPARLRLPVRKARLLHDALIHLALKPTVCVETLRSAVGVWIWGVLLRRAFWWPSAREEVRWMAGAVMGLYADWGSPLLLAVLATDAGGAPIWRTKEVSAQWSLGSPPSWPKQRGWQAQSQSWCPQEQESSRDS